MSLSLIVMAGDLAANLLIYMRRARNAFTVNDVPGFFYLRADFRVRGNARPPESVAAGDERA